jgi:hypothetical protein
VCCCIGKIKVFDEKEHWFIAVLRKVYKNTTPIPPSPDAGIV